MTWAWIEDIKMDVEGIIERGCGPDKFGAG
jgi:hypothetical protein